MPKIPKSLVVLNKDQPTWDVVENFVQKESLQQTLIDFLKDYVQYEDEDLVFYEKLAINALHILGHLQKEEVLPFIVEIFNHQYVQIDENFDEEEEEEEEEEYDEYWDDEEDFEDDVNEGLFGPKIVEAAQTAVALLAKNKKFKDTFWTLYKVHLDKEIALEYLRGVILSEVSTFNNAFENSLNSPISNELKDALTEEFSENPFFVAHHSLLTLNTSFIDQIELLLLDDTKFLSSNPSDQQAENQNPVWGHILMTWFILKAIDENQISEVKDFIEFYIRDQFQVDFHQMYHKEKINAEDEEKLERAEKQIFVVKRKIEKEIKDTFKIQINLPHQKNFNADNVLPLFKM